MTCRRITCIATVFLLPFAIAGCSNKPETLIEDYDEAKMEEAMAEANSTLDQFFTRFRNPQPGDDAFALKVRIEDDNGAEHFWLGQLDLEKEPYSGVIDNEPGIVECVKLGERYSFAKEDISDWMYMSSGKMQGNYTLRVALESMPPEKAAAIKNAFGW